MGVHHHIWIMDFFAFWISILPAELHSQVILALLEPYLKSEISIFLLNLVYPEHLSI